MGHEFEAFVIGIIVLFRTVGLGFIQECRAERAMSRAELVKWMIRRGWFGAS